MSTPALFARLGLVDVHRDVVRNIVSIRSSQDLFDDLTSEPAEWELAQQVERETKPPPFRSPTPAIHRPFEDAAWFNAIRWPFEHWQASRFSDGSFGVWYGADSVETTVYETAYHWYRGFLTDAGFENESVIGERKLYSVACDAVLLDLRPVVREHPDIAHRNDYSAAQAVGARLHREGHPGLLAPSVRRAQGENYVVFNSTVLSNARITGQLTYRLERSRIHVEQKPGRTWFVIDAATL
jgi:hypothetical protein